MLFERSHRKLKSQELSPWQNNIRKEQPFAGIHICPASSLDVPDEQAARLVILGPAAVYKAVNPNNNAMKTILDIFNNRGNSPRNFRNMLAFSAPDQELMLSLKQAVRLYIAWKSVKDDS